MSAGNVVLYSNVFNTTTFSTISTLLGAGNYWIEEIDITIAYAITSAATGGTSVVLQLGGSGGIFHYTNYLIPPTSGAVVVPLNFIVTSRPRIFIPRGANITFLVAGGSAQITSFVNTVNLYGRSLP